MRSVILRSELSSQKIRGENLDIQYNSLITLLLSLDVLIITTASCRWQATLDNTACNGHITQQLVTMSKLKTITKNGDDASLAWICQ